MNPPSDAALNLACAILVEEVADLCADVHKASSLARRIATALDAAHAAGFREGVEAGATVCEAHADHQGANMTAGPMPLDARRTAATQITTARFLAGCCRALKPTEPA